MEREFQRKIEALRRKQNLIGITYYVILAALVVLVLFSVFHGSYQVILMRGGLIRELRAMFLMALGIRILLALLLIYLAMQAWRSLLTDLQAARQLDRTNNDQYDTYQNACELKRQKQDNPLLERVYDLADEKATGQNIEPDTRSLKRILLPSLMILVVTLSAIFISPKAFGTSWKAFQMKEYPQVKHRSHIDVKPGDLTILRNDTVEITVVDPEPQVEYGLFYTLGDMWRQTPMIDSYKKFTNTEQSFRYYVKNPWAVSDTFSVEVFELPAVTKIDVRYDFPAYTGMKPETYLNTDGNLKAIVGTVAGLTVETNNPIEDARIVLGSGTTVELTRQGRTTFSVNVPIDDNGTYYFKMIDLLGNESGRLVKSITAIDDKIPEVRIAYPGRDTILSQNHQLPLQILGADDFGLKNLSLHYDLNSAGEEAIDLRLGIGSKLLDYQTTFDLSPMKMLPGDRVVYWVELTDYSPQSNVGVSDRYTVRFPSIEEIYEEIEAQEEEKREALEEAREKAEDLAKEFEEKRRELMKKEEADWEDQKSLEEMMKRQEDLNKQVEDVAQEYKELADKFNQNDALSEETLEKMERIQELMEQINNEQLKEAMEKMQNAMENMKMDDVQKAMEQMKFSMEDFMQKLDQTIDLLEDIKKEQALQKSAEIAEEMFEMQKDLNERTEKGEESPQNLGKEQEQIGDKLDKLQEQIEKTDGMLDEQKDSELKKMMEELREMMKQDSLAQDIQESSESLEQNQMQQAQQSQQSASQKMQSMLDKLKQMQSMMSGGMQTDIGTILQDTITRLLFFSQMHERSSQQYLRDPFAILDRQLANYEGIQLTLQKLYAVPMIPLYLHPKFFSDASMTVKRYQEMFTSVNDKPNSSINTFLEDIQSGINLMIYDLMQSASSMSQSQGGGMQSLMQQLQQMSGEQMMLNSITQQLLQQMLSQGQLPGDARSEMRRMAEDEERMAENMRRMLQNNPDALKGGSGLEDVTRQLEDVAKDLRYNRLDQELVDRQNRILSRMLDAQKSINDREYSKKRKAESGEEKDWELPEDLRLRFEEIRRRALLQEDYKEYPREYQDVILEYLRRLNEDSIDRGGTE